MTITQLRLIYIKTYDHVKFYVKMLPHCIIKDQIATSLHHNDFSYTFFLIEKH